MTRVTSKCIATTLLFMLGTLIGVWIGTSGNDITLKHLVLTALVSSVFYATQKFSLTSITINK